MSTETAPKERTQTPEEQAEFGKRTYDLMTEITTNLLATPEFMRALGGAFFRRQQFRHSRNTIDSVYFKKGDFEYLVQWFSARFEPSSHGQPEVRDLIRSELKITKYDPKESTEDSTGGWLKRVASARIGSDFLEDEDDKDRGILRFIEGYITLDENYDLDTSWETPPSWRSAEPAKTTERKDAIDKLPEVFVDLYPTPVKI